MPCNLDLGENVRHNAFRIHQKRRTLNPHILFPVHLLLLPETAGFDKNMLRIAQKGKGNPKLRRKLPVTLDRIGAYTDDTAIQRLKCGQPVRKVPDFVCSP